MNLMERDAYVLGLLAQFAAQGLSPRQCVLRTIATAGVGNIILQGHDLVALDRDVSGLQAVVATLTDPATLAAATTVYNTSAAGGLLPKHPTAPQVKGFVSTTDGYKSRVLNSKK